MWAILYFITANNAKQACMQAAYRLEASGLKPQAVGVSDR